MLKNILELYIINHRVRNRFSDSDFCEDFVIFLLCMFVVYVISFFMQQVLQSFVD